MRDTNFERQSTTTTNSAQYQVYQDGTLVDKFDSLSDAHNCFLSLTGDSCWILDTHSGSIPIWKEKVS